MGKIMKNKRGLELVTIRSSGYKSLNISGAKGAFKIKQKAFLIVFEWLSFG